MAPTGNSRLLSREPHARVENVRELLGLASAVEVEAVRRYAQLASLMEQRGERDTAAIFHQMREIEQSHVDFVEGRAHALEHDLAPAGEFTWRLPPEIAGSWSEIQRSALLTPYRALAIAVINEERTFALYSYIASASNDPDVTREAETLAREELFHAAELRVRRRQAYHHEFPGRVVPAAKAVETLTEFHDLEARLSQQAATALHSTAQALAVRGDNVSAELVAGLAQREAEAARAAGVAPAPATVMTDAGSKDSAVRLQEALRPLETSSEAYEEVIARAAHDDLLQAAQASLHRVVEGISALGRRLSEVDAGGVDGQP